jgi:HK97 family phage major capsid protein
MFKKLLNIKIKAQQDIVNGALAENRGLNADEQAKFNALQEEIKNLEASVAAEELLASKEPEARVIATPAIHATPSTPEVGIKPFANFAEQLRAVKNVATTGVGDERLNKLNNEYIRNAPLGANEGLPEEGGFAVQTDFAGMMMNTAATAGNILPLVDRYEIGAGSNGVRWNDIDETSVATTVFGGVQVYWAAEAATVNPTGIKLKEYRMELEKLLGFAYATYELDQDSNFISQLYSRAFTLAIQRELENCILTKIGAGIPQSILNSGWLVSAAKEVGQAADTVLWENISAMYHRQLNKNSAVWIVNPDLVEQFDFMSVPIGTGGVPVYLQQAIAGTVPTLKGRPIIECDHCSAIGDKGDIMFNDMSQYMLITKGGIAADTSMHVQFLTAQNCFRFIFRANGMTKKNKVVTPKNSAKPKSPFVTLDAR